MKIPSLGNTQFAILTGLLDGGSLTIGELAERIEWTLNPNSLILLAGRMHKPGLIAKADELLRNGETRRVYQITESGRLAWQESADFYLTLIERAQAPPSANGDSSDVICRKEVPPPDKPPARERIATPTEFQDVMAHADQAFGRVYRVLWTLNSSAAVMEKFPAGVSALEVTQLQIADADLHAGGLTIQGRKVLLDEAGRQAIRDAAGERTGGLLFCTQSGRPYQSATIASYFRTAARKAGLPAEVKLIGRGNSWRHRHQKKY